MEKSTSGVHGPCQCWFLREEFRGFRSRVDNNQNGGFPQTISPNVSGCNGKKVNMRCRSHLHHSSRGFMWCHFFHVGLVTSSTGDDNHLLIFFPDDLSSLNHRLDIIRKREENREFFRYLHVKGLKRHLLGVFIINIIKRLLFSNNLKKKLIHILTCISMGECILVISCLIILKVF